MQLARVGQAERHVRRRDHQRRPWRDAPPRRRRALPGRRGRARRSARPAARSAGRPAAGAQGPAAASGRPTGRRRGCRAAQPARRPQAPRRARRAAPPRNRHQNVAFSSTREARFQGVEMPNIVALLAHAALRRRRRRRGSSPRQAPAGRRWCESAWSCRSRSAPAAAAPRPPPTANESSANSERPPRIDVRPSAISFMRASPARRRILEPFYKTGVRHQASEMRAHPPPADDLQGTHAASRLPDGPQGDRDHERRPRIARHLQMPQDPQGRSQDLRVFLPARRGEERARRHLQAAHLAQGADREPAAASRTAAASRPTTSAPWSTG